MKCPICNVDLVMSERQSVEIDYCPQCRGVWLDRGELNKIIERSNNENSKENREESNRPDPYQDKHRERNYDNNEPTSYRKKKRESFLGDLFDF